MSPASTLLVEDLGRLPGLQNVLGFIQQEALAETPRRDAHLVRQCHSYCSCSCLSLSSAGAQHVLPAVKQEWASTCNVPEELRIQKEQFKGLLLLLPSLLLRVTALQRREQSDPSAWQLLQFIQGINRYWNWGVWALRGWGAVAVEPAYFPFSFCRTYIQQILAYWKQ